MTTTAKDLIQRAYARHAGNDPDKTAGRGELIAVLSDFLRSIYASVAALEEPGCEFFEASEDVSGSVGSWDRPDDAISVFRVEDADEVEVSVVRFNDRFSDLAPRIYALGRTFKTVGEDDDPGSAAVLTFFYAKDHPALDPTLAWDHADNTLDDSWPERHNNLLVVRLARHLAEKRSGADAVTLQEEEDRNLALLLAEAAGADAATVSR